MSDFKGKEDPAYLAAVAFLSDHGCMGSFVTGYLNGLFDKLESLESKDSYILELENKFSEFITTHQRLILESRRHERISHWLAFQLVEAMKTLASANPDYDGSGFVGDSIDDQLKHAFDAVKSGWERSEL